MNGVEAGIAIIALLSGAAAVNSYRAMNSTSKLAERVSALEARVEILLKHFNLKELKK